MFFQKSVVFFIACFTLTGLLFIHTIHLHAESLKIYLIDVGPADAALVVSPGGKTLLIDSGNNSDGAKIRAVMKNAGIRRIDHFVCTHYHDENYGGIDELAGGGVLIVHTYDRGDKSFLPAKKIASRVFQDYSRAAGNRAVHLKRGSTIPLDPEVLITCVASGGVVLGENPVRTGDTENDMSIALLIQYRAFKYFIGGGIGKEVEDQIHRLHLMTNVDLYQSRLKELSAAGTITIEVNRTENRYTMTMGNKLYAFQIRDRGIPESELVIHGLMPNPVGDDRTNEMVLLKNKGDLALAMTDWKLKNKKGQIWPLGGLGIVHSGQIVTAVRNQLPMSLDDQEDKITLMGPNNEIVDTFSYESTEKGTLMATGH